MWFFRRSKDKPTPVEERKQSSRPFKISMTERDYGEMFHCDVAMKVWLPESIELQLSEITDFLDIPVSDFVRQILFQHLYGRYDLLGHVERKLFTFDDPDHVQSRVRFALARIEVDEVPPEPMNAAAKTPPEPKIAALRVNIPQRMKTDLLHLAGKKHLTISHYARNVIVAHLLGHQDTIPSAPPDVDEGIQ